MTTAQKMSKTSKKMLVITELSILEQNTWKVRKQP